MIIPWFFIILKYFTRITSKFCNILLTWSTDQQFLPRLWMWQTTLHCEMPISPDTLLFLLTIFASMAWKKASKSTVLVLPDFVWLLKYLQPKQKFLEPSGYCNYDQLLITQQFFLIFSLIWFGFMVYQLLQVIQCQILFLYIC